ncbi:hypothetical protein D6C77_04815 [Aureobasidium pullulans]|nr:hypothetical protein D6C77_04815 [Aureobasidium pullulans]
MGCHNIIQDLEWLNFLDDIELVSVVYHHYRNQFFEHSLLIADNDVYLYADQWNRYQAVALVLFVLCFPDNVTNLEYSHCTPAFDFRNCCSQPSYHTSTSDAIPNTSSTTTIPTLSTETSSTTTSTVPSSTESLSSVSITSSTTSIASILTASGSPTISPTTTSSAIPSSILILPTTTPPSSSSSTTSSTSTSSTATATVSSDSSNTTASATTSKSTTNHLSSQEIAGISFGAVAAAAIFSLLLFALYRRRRARQAAAAAAANDKHNSFPESAWLYDPRMTPSPPSAAAIAASHNHTPSVISSMHSSISSSASRRDATLLSAIATPALLPQRQTSNHIGRALTSNPPVTAASKRHRISSSVPEFKLLPKTPSAAAVDATPVQTKRESLPAILKIGHGAKSRPVTVAPAAAGPSLLGSIPNKPLPPRPVIAAKDRPFSFEAGDDGAQQFGIAK